LHTPKNDSRSFGRVSSESLAVAGTPGLIRSELLIALLPVSPSSRTIGRMLVPVRKGAISAGAIPILLFIPAGSDAVRTLYVDSKFFFSAPGLVVQIDSAAMLIITAGKPRRRQPNVFGIPGRSASHRIARFGPG